MVSLLCIGLATHDYIASVKSFPQPDTKIRTTHTLQVGGGNAANVSVAAKRLLNMEKDKVWFCGKLGNDVLSSVILSGLEKEGVETELCISHNDSQSSTSSSPFTYILVDTQQDTRTCVHTPGPEFCSHELNTLKHRLQCIPIDVIFLDTRHGEAATTLTKSVISSSNSNDNQMMIFADVEKERPHLYDTLSMSTHLFISQTFIGYYPFQFLDGDKRNDKNIDDDKILNHICDLLFNTINKKHNSCIIVTCGKDGCFLFRNNDTDTSDSCTYHNSKCFVRWHNGSKNHRSLTSFEREVHHLLNSYSNSEYDHECECDCIAGAILLPDKQSALNVIYCSRYRSITSEEIIDTTGAGDAFAGAFITATFLSNRYHLKPSSFLVRYPHLPLAAATFVANMACTKNGSREGCPTALPSAWYEQMSQIKL